MTIINKRRVNSRQKGKRGELEFVHMLRKKGLKARRGQQFAGGADSPDVMCADLADVHFEIKRVQGCQEPYKWMDQAKRDAGPGELHVVGYRRNAKEWLAIIPMDELLDLLITRAGVRVFVEAPPEAVDEWLENAP